jgi:hypothetical protein
LNRRRTAYETVLGTRLQSTPQSVPPAGLEPAVNASTSGRCRRRWATGVAIVVPAGFEPATSAMWARRALRAAPRNHVSRAGRSRTCLRTAYQTVAWPLGHGPKPAPCTGIEPVSPVRQTGWHASFITGQQERLAGVEPAYPPWQGSAWTARPQARLGHEQARVEGVEPSACGLEPNYSPRSTPLLKKLPRQVSNLQPSCEQRPALPFELQGKSSVRMAGLEPAISGIPSSPTS